MGAQYFPCKEKQYTTRTKALEEHFKFNVELKIKMFDVGKNRFDCYRVSSHS